MHLLHLPLPLLLLASALTLTLATLPPSSLHHIRTLATRHAQADVSGLSSRAQPPNGVVKPNSNCAKKGTCNTPPAKEKKVENKAFAAPNQAIDLMSLASRHADADARVVYEVSNHNFGDKTAVDVVSLASRGADVFADEDFAVYARALG